MYKSLSFSSFGTTDGKNIDAWRSKIEVPVFPQGGRKGAITLKYRPIMAAVFILMGILLIYSYVAKPDNELNYQLYPGKILAGQKKQFPYIEDKPYNNSYPLTKPITTTSGVMFKIGLITDMDTESKHPEKSNTWKSILLLGNLTYNSHAQRVTVDFGKSAVDTEGIQLTSSYSYKGRGMELSELTVFNGRLYTVDDRTGIVYEITDNKPIPWAILSDGNGKELKGFKGEWMTVKDEMLYVGGLGKEWTTATGEVLHTNPQWIKIINKDRSIVDVKWVPNYLIMQKASGYTSPGYIIHESAVWSDIHRSWFFLPRRASHEKYDETLDEQRATNLLFQCSDDFSDIKVIRIGKIDYPARGFSSFKFIPGTRDQMIVALKTEEVSGRTKSYITAFTLDGTIVMSDTLVSLKYKYEGVEFL